MVRSNKSSTLLGSMIPSQNSLWHLDGNLKLVRWELTIHTAIDGYSRVMFFAKISDNNCAETVLKHFKQAEELHGKPSRVRCDYGGENTLVGEYML